MRLFRGKNHWSLAFGFLTELIRFPPPVMISKILYKKWINRQIEYDKTSIKNMEQYSYSDIY